jgi:MinD-like ATPase involved in chromosome partitioning or flagellar assembly
MEKRRYGRVITFYSFKGGVGRTQALADVAVLLARYGHRVLMVDWDLEAPGLESYFRAWLPSPETDGVLELVNAFDQHPPEEAATRYETLRLPGLEDRLALLRAGRQDTSHDERVQRLDWDGLYSRGFGRWLESLRSRWQQDWDFILVDSRTGINDIGAICTMQLPEILVLLFTPNEQSVLGAERAARAAVDGQRRMRIDRAPLRVVPVLTRVDSSEHLLQQEWLQRSTERFTPWVDDWSDAPGRAADLMTRLLVPYVPYWSYGEQVPVLQKSIQAGVERAHEALALLLHQGLSDVGSLLDDYSRLVADAQAAYRFKHDVFVSYPSEEREVARRLVDGLRARGVRVAWDLDLGPGSSWDEDIPLMINESRNQILIWTESAPQHQYRDLVLSFNINRSEPRSRKLIPIYLPGTSRIPYGLSSIQGIWLSSHDQIKEHIEDLAAALKPDP